MIFRHRKYQTRLLDTHKQNSILERTNWNSHHSYFQMQRKYNEDFILILICLCFIGMFREVLQRRPNFVLKPNEIIFNHQIFRHRENQMWIYYWCFYFCVSMEWWQKFYKEKSIFVWTYRNESQQLMQRESNEDFTSTLHISDYLPGIIGMVK